MALVQKSNKKSVTILLSVLVGVTVIGLLVYFLVIAPPDVDPNVNTSNNIVQRDLPIYTTFGEDLFDDPRFRALVPYGDLPVDLGDVGRTNPFEKPSP
ncbi:MAG: hypothetical protein H6760_00905 [Candidatus Nomurabacteria bacterium]|nr:MAG: hypothetical protein H6760_00905 [Candidatus Nomurabacteria bacterium]